MPSSNSHTPKGWATGAGGFTSWVNVKVYQSGWQNAKKVFRCISPGVWTEVWSNRPVVTTAAGTSSAFDRITANGAVNPNNFSATPRFYYKKNADGAYTAGTELTALTGATSQDVTSTITGLVENTTYNYYLSATNSAGTSDIPTVRNVTTPLDCRTVANGGTGWGSSSSSVGALCGTCGSKTVTTTTYTKSGCEPTSPYNVVSETTCTEDACGCKTAGTNGWTNKAQETRVVHCGSYCNGQNQYRQVIEKAGCTDHVATDWTNTGECTDRVTSQNANNLPNGWVMWMERYGYGQADNRKVVVYPSTRQPFSPYNYVFGDDTYCYSCFLPYGGCNYGVTYSVVLCPLTSAYYWVDSSCTADL
jgi:hypothetical protein